MLLFRASAEILMNIIKHAEASAVHVNVDRLGRTVYMVFEDNGKQYRVSRPGEAIRTHEGFGLFRIGDPFAHVGATFVVELQATPGTKATSVATCGPINRATSGSEKS